MQKFIVEITEENEALIQDPALECYLITSSLDRGFAAGFARRAAAAGKLVLAGGGDAPALCRDLGLDGFVLDVSASEKIKADFDRAVKTAGKDKVSGLLYMIISLYLCPQDAIQTVIHISIIKILLPPASIHRIATAVSFPDSVIDFIIIGGRYGYDRCLKGFPHSIGNHIQSKELRHDT